MCAGDYNLSTLSSFPRGCKLVQVQDVYIGDRKVMNVKLIGGVAREQHLSYVYVRTGKRLLQYDSLQK